MHHSVRGGDIDIQDSRRRKFRSGQSFPTDRAIAWRRQYGSAGIAPGDHMVQKNAGKRLDRKGLHRGDRRSFVGHSKCGHERVVCWGKNGELPPAV